VELIGEVTADAFSLELAVRAVVIWPVGTKFCCSTEVTEHPNPVSLFFSLSLLG
jgi:hypothetical protein